MITFSIIQKSQLEGAKRLDAEYYQPEYLGVVQKLGNTKTIADLAEDVMYGLYIEPDYKQEGVNFIRALNLGDFCIDGEILKIDKNLVPKNYLLQTGDALIVRSGANTGDVGLVYDEFTGATFGSYVIRIRFNNKINPFFATMFLNSKYGVAQTKRLQTGMAQPNLNIPNIKEIKIPDYISQNSQKKIEKIVFEGDSERKNGVEFYQQAENLFLKELNLNDFQQADFLSTVINLSEAQEANRFDAEYFNSPCNKMLAQMTKDKVAKLGDLVDIIKGVEPGADAYRDEPADAEATAGKRKLFIRVSNISKDGIIDKDQKYLSDDLYNEYKKDYQPQVSEILLTKDASIGVACVVREPVEGIVAGGVLRLKLSVQGKEKINPEYLALVLNSIVGQLQAERDAGGSIIAHWKPEQIKNLIVPILSVSIQEKIADLVVKSHQARKKAKELLEEARLKVEEMIEK